MSAMLSPCSRVLLVALPALIASCEQDYSDPETLVKGQIHILLDLAEAASQCKSNDAVPMEKALRRLVPEQRRLSAALNKMNEAQRQEVIALGKGKYAKETYATSQALRVCLEKFGRRVAPELRQELNPQLKELMEALMATGLE